MARVFAVLLTILIVRNGETKSLPSSWQPDSVNAVNAAASQERLLDPNGEELKSVKIQCIEAMLKNPTDYPDCISQLFPDDDSKKLLDDVRNKLVKSDSAEEGKGSSSLLETQDEVEEEASPEIVKNLQSLKDRLKESSESEEGSGNSIEEELQQVQKDGVVDNDSNNNNSDDENMPSSELREFPDKTKSTELFGDEDEDKGSDYGKTNKADDIEEGSTSFEDLDKSTGNENPANEVLKEGNGAPLAYESYSKNNLYVDLIAADHDMLVKDHDKLNELFKLVNSLYQDKDFQYKIAKRRFESDDDDDDDDDDENDKVDNSDEENGDDTAKEFDGNDIEDNADSNEEEEVGDKDTVDDDTSKKEDSDIPDDAKKDDDDDEEEDGGNSEGQSEESGEQAVKEDVLNEDAASNEENTANDKANEVNGDDLWNEVDTEDDDDDPDLNLNEDDDEEDDEENEGNDALVNELAMVDLIDAGQTKSGTKSENYGEENEVLKGTTSEEDPVLELEKLPRKYKDVLKEELLANAAAAAA
ncbi:uncharacterized protein LOC144447533 isoform X2 [Glandiceps talaboti]